MLIFKVLNAFRALTWAWSLHGGQWQLNYICWLYLLSALMDGQGGERFTVNLHVALLWKHLKKCLPASYVKCSILGDSCTRQSYHQSHFEMTYWTIGLSMSVTIACTKSCSWVYQLPIWSKAACDIGVMWGSKHIMAYSSTPYVGMALKKNGGHIKSAQMTRLKCLR